MTRRDPEMTRDDVDTAILLALVWRILKGLEELPQTTPWRLISAASHCLLLRVEFSLHDGRPQWSVAVSDGYARGLLTRRGYDLDAAVSELRERGLLPESGGGA